jgi:hypothetical protein
MLCYLTVAVWQVTSVDVCVYVTGLTGAGYEAAVSEAAEIEDGNTSVVHQLSYRVLHLLNLPRS